MEAINQKKSFEEDKMSFKNKMMLLAVFGALLGFTVKTEAIRRITVGFEDYKLAGNEKKYDINQSQKELETKQALQKEQKNASQNNAPASDQSSTKGGTSETVCDANSGASCK